MPFNVVCQQCGITFSVHARSVAEKRKFCSIKCKSIAKVEDKPVTKEWLYDKYIVEKMDCVQIGKIVGRDAKSIWTWLKNFGIPTRTRGFEASGTPFKKGHKIRLGITHTEESKEKIRRTREERGIIPVLAGKSGPETPNWKGGITSARAKFHQSPEWKEVSKIVRKRDGFRCRRCGLSMVQARKLVPIVRFNVHHIISFSVEERRLDVNNLVLICRTCHYFIHSSENTDREFLDDPDRFNKSC